MLANTEYNDNCDVDHYLCGFIGIFGTIECRNIKTVLLYVDLAALLFVSQDHLREQELETMVFFLFFKELEIVTLPSLYISLCSLNTGRKSRK